MNPAPPVIRVAVVEDHDGYREELCRQLDEAEGFACVFTAETPSAARNGLADSRPDVLLLDLDFDGRPEGIALAQTFSQRLPELEIVILTVADDMERVFGALQAGASGYLLKGSSTEQILDGVRQATEGGSPMTGSIARMVVRSLRNHPPDILTAREWTVLRALAEGQHDKQIAASLDISTRTVHSHCRTIYRKLQVDNRHEAAAWWHRQSP